MNKDKDLESWPLWLLTTFSLLFLFGIVPCLIIGAKQDPILMGVISVLIAPQMIGLWICTIIEWRDKLKKK